MTTKAYKVKGRIRACSFKGELGRTTRVGIDESDSKIK